MAYIKTLLLSRFSINLKLFFSNPSGCRGETRLEGGVGVGSRSLSSLLAGRKVSPLMSVTSGAEELNAICSISPL